MRGPRHTPHGEAALVVDMTSMIGKRVPTSRQLAAKECGADVTGEE